MYGWNSNTRNFGDSVHIIRIVHYYISSTGRHFETEKCCRLRLSRLSTSASYCILICFTELDGTTFFVSLCRNSVRLKFKYPQLWRLLKVQIVHEWDRSFWVELRLLHFWLRVAGNFSAFLRSRHVPLGATQIELSFSRFWILAIVSNGGL